MKFREASTPSLAGSLFIAFSLTMIAAALRAVMDPFLGDRSPFATFLVAVAIASWLSGWRGGWIAIVLGALGADFFFMSPRNAFNLASPDTLIQTVLFVSVSAVIVAISEVRIAQDRRIRHLLEEARRDIEHRLEAEKALAESEAKFRAVAETASTAIYIHDGTKLVYVNPAAERVLGYTREELYQQDLWGMVHPDHREVVKQRAAARFQGKASPERYEYKLVHKNGTDVWVDFGATVIDYEGRRCILANAFDVTQRKLSEEALIRSEKLASAGRLAATIAHEINNPLEAVTNLLYLARVDGANAQKYLESAEGELRRVAHIARQTLGFYRDSNQPESVEVARLIRDVLSLYAKRLETKGVTVRAELADNVKLQASSGELRQIVSNLISNAIDALPTSGKLRIHLRETRHARTGDPGLRLVVADDGVGIPVALKSKIFDAFFTTKQDIGTGLGLWVTRSLVEKQGGTVRVRSRVSSDAHGTVFSIFFPFSTGENHHEQAA